MATKHRNIFLYLTLVCFVGLILIFIFDGYIGTYDTVFVTASEYEQKIETDFWLRPYNQPSASVERGGKVFFRYEVDNRRFSDYTADIEVSVWQSQEKIRDLMLQRVSVSSFDKGQLEWVLDTRDIIPEDAPAEQGYQYTVVVTRGDIERKIIVFINPVPYPPKPVIGPSR